MKVSRRGALVGGAAGLAALATAAGGAALGASRESGLRVALPLIQTAGAAAGNDPPAEVIAMGRMAYGQRPGDLARLRQIGLEAYIDEQLRPDDAADAACNQRLAAATLRIAYDGNDEFPAVDEQRPLRTLDAPAADLWWLNDWERDIPWEERFRPVEEVRAATLIRAVYSKWQLREVLVEFWHNHFNVNAENDDTRIFATWPLYDREVIRRHALGNFREFLEAVAASPAMLAYLNNAESKTGPANENYARELFELHTLGAMHYLNDRYEHWRDVPGAAEGRPVGYIDDDVYEAARAFTGWSIADGTYLTDVDRFPNTGAFHYHDGWHDHYQKRVLATELPSHQAPLADGRKVLDLVADHPGTAYHLSLKLCRRLVADNPPEALVRRIARVWTEQRRAPDQIAQVVRAILRSPEFSAGWGRKVKRPLEVVVSFLRATGAELTPNNDLVYYMARHGYQLFSWPAPNGHPDVAGYWLSSNAMLGRWNLPLTLTSDWLGAAQFDLVGQTPGGSARAIAAFWAERMLGYRPPESTLAPLVELIAQDGSPNSPPAYDDDDDRAARITALVTLAAMLPEFHWR